MKLPLSYLGALPLSYPAILIVDYLQFMVYLAQECVDT